MNRDESVQRATALAPQVTTCGKRTALFPSEPEGGTWVGVNDAGICAALINWYAVPRAPGRVRRSRGIVVPAVLKASTAEEARELAEAFPKNGLAPFRLLVFAARERVAREFRWDQREFSELSYPWEPAHWFSSGFDEPQAQAERAGVARTGWRRPDAGGLPWLRRLHGSHEPARGPFSFCMHRKDAATVSYTEIVIDARNAIMRYHDGPPCCAPQPVATGRISRRKECKESEPGTTNGHAGFIQKNQQCPLRSARRPPLSRGLSPRGKIVEITVRGSRIDSANL